MKIAAKERFVATVGLAAVAIIAAMVWWTYAEIQSDDRQRMRTIEIARGLTELRLLTFDYRLYHNERSRVQRGLVAARIDRLIADATFTDPAQLDILTRLSEQQAAGQRLFAELTATRGADYADALLDDVSRRFEAQLLTRLLGYQQDSLTDAFRLNQIATDRINSAQRRLMFAILTGLTLTMAIMIGASWHTRRHVLAPVAALEQATRRVAAGNWEVMPGIQRNDEIGELSKNFDAMTRSLKESFAEMDRSNRNLATLNEELKAFSYSVSHDLRGPLRSLDGFSLVLLEDYGDKLDEEGRDGLQRIRAASQRMGELIDDLLRLSQVTRADLSMTRVDLSAISREIADAVDRDQPGRSVEWIIEPGLTMQADAPLMRIAMQNLLQNAWKFSGKKERAVIRVGSAQRGGKNVFFVADNGAGFDMAHTDRLFGAFQRLHKTSEFPGTGIGLTIVQRILRRHHGSIVAEAVADEGAAFYFNVKEANNGTDEQDHLAG
jgi:signal transduction histidine kinase